MQVDAALRRPDGTTISYDAAGNGPAVVFLHGLTSSRRSWGPVTDLLTEDFTCVRIDLRGHGDSSPAPDYAMPSIIGDVHAVVEAMGFDAPAIVGHSFGGSVAAVYAAAFTPRATVCVDVTLRYGDFAEQVQPYADALRGERAMHALIEIEHRLLGLEPFSGIAEMERRILDFPPDVMWGIWEALLTRQPHELTAAAEGFLPRITAPLLALHGSPLPPDYEAWLTRLVPAARVELWDGMGHMLHLVDPDRFAARVRSFLRTNAPAS
jgi:pimeloyl-ACP methyl ester carboxylesterase